MPRVKIESEAAVREWMRHNWLGPIDWTEAAMGGTAGLPDCAVIDPVVGRVELELKMWVIGKNGLKATARASQIKYHTEGVKLGKLTGFLVGIKYENKVLDAISMYQSDNLLDKRMLGSDLFFLAGCDIKEALIDPDYLSRKVRWVSNMNNIYPSLDRHDKNKRNYARLTELFSRKWGAK